MQQRVCGVLSNVGSPLGPGSACLGEWVRSLPSEQQARISKRFAEAKAQLLSQGLWKRLSELGDTTTPPHDDALEEVNRRYYALRMPCPFLEEESCTIYDERPVACRELLVTSPADRCQDLINNPVEPIPVPVRMSTVLGLLWQELTNLRRG